MTIIYNRDQKKWKGGTALKDYDLKPCPFCGSPNVYIVQCDDANTLPVYFVECGICLNRTYARIDHEQVVKAWNKRTGDG